jgi:hypothetical protein
MGLVLQGCAETLNAAFPLASCEISPLKSQKIMIITAIMIIESSYLVDHSGYPLVI